MIDIDPVGIVGSGVILSPPRFFVAGVDFCTVPSYFKIRKAVFHLYHDSPPLIPYRRRSSFFWPPYFIVLIANLILPKLS